MWDLMIKLDDWMYKDLDTAYKHSCDLVDMAVSFGDTAMMAEGYAGLGYISFYRSHTPEALSYFNLSHQLMLKLKDSVDIANSLINFGNVYTNIGLFQKGLDYYQISEKYLLSNSSEYATVIRAYLYYNTAEVFLDLDDTQNCKEYLMKSEKYALLDSATSLLIAIKNVQAKLLLMEGRLEEARKYAQLALTQAENYPDFQEKTVALETLSKISAVKGDSIKALDFQKQALETALAYKEPELLAEQENFYAERLLGMGRADEALQYSKDAYAYAKQSGSQLLIKRTAPVLSVILESLGDFEGALKYQKIFHAAKDSLASINLRERILESQTRLNEQKNELLHTQMKFQEQVISQNKIILLGITTALLLSIILIAVLSQSLKRKRRTQKMIEEKQKLINHQSEKLKANNEDLQQLNKNKDKLFSILTHDLKQPFNQTITLLEILQSYDIEDKDLTNLISQVKEATAETKSTVDNLLTWSKSQFTSIKKTPKRIQLSSVTDHLQQEFKQTISEKELKCLFNVNHELAVIADPNHLEIILRNIFQNAIKFSDEGGHIEIAASKAQDKVTICVKDHGKGMSKEQINFLFDANTHFSTPGTLNEKGTGLGMLIVDEFVRENDGTIEVESTLGEGTVFKVSLPSA